MRGRKPKPTAVKEGQNSFQRHPERRNAGEPQAKRGRPVKPAHIETSEVASMQWDELCDTLDELNILTTADRSLLALYCQTYAEWMKLQQHVAEHGATIFNDKGNASQSPEAIQVHRYADRLLKMMAELGLTPSSRSRLVAPKQEQDSTISDLINLMTSRN